MSLVEEMAERHNNSIAVIAKRKLGEFGSILAFSCVSARNPWSYECAYRMRLS